MPLAGVKKNVHPVKNMAENSANKPSYILFFSMVNRRFGVRIFLPNAHYCALFEVIMDERGSVKFLISLRVSYD